MTLQSSGAISIGNISTELGVSATSARSMNDSSSRTLAGVPSGAISMSNFYGKSNTFISTINLTSGADVNLRTVANAAGYNGAQGATITFNVPNAVTIRGSAGGGIGLDTGTWPTGTYTIALTLVVQSGGIVDGGGGTGGNGQGDVAAGTAGGVGGDAIYCQIPLSGGITINSGGTVRGGGGGGGGGAQGSDGSPNFDVTAGGGGGGGNPNGAGGTGGTTSGNVFNGSNGTAGTTSTPGNGGLGATGAGRGGNGGSFGSSGNVGGGTGYAAGAAGFAVRKNGNTVTVTNNGTMTGSAA